MSKLWVALLFVLLLAVLLTVGLTVTFVYKGKREKKSDKTKELFWKFHLEPVEHKTEGPAERVVEFDLYKTSDYTAGDVKVTLKHLSHKFGETKVVGWAHNFEEALPVKKVVADGKELPLTRAVLSSGFTVFLKESDPDFVTLWHDGEFKHYNTSGELLSTGLFPFAENDYSKHPRVLNLPQGREVGEVLRPEPLVPKPTGKPDESPEKPSEEPKEPKADASTETLPSDKPEDEVPALPEVMVDLSLASRVKLGEKYSYVYKGVEAEITRHKFGAYTRFVYSVGFMRKFTPHLKLNTTEVRLPETKGVLELDLYTHDDEVPLVVAYRDEDGFHSWRHKGQNHWDRHDGPVTADLLEDSYCTVHRLVSFDLSSQSGTYPSGEFDVAVKPVTDSKLPKEFVCFSHEATMSYRPGKPRAHVKVFKYKFRKVHLNGLPTDKEVSLVTSCFWRGNLGTPLLLRLKTRTEELSFVGHGDYVLETEEHVPERVSRANLDANRAFTVNLRASEDYKFTGGETKVFSFKDVEVKSVPYPEVAGVRKFVHRLSLLPDDDKPFYVTGFLGHDELTLPASPVSAVETYFVRGTEDPVMVVLRDTLKEYPRDRLFSLDHRGKLVEQELLGRSFDFTLRYVAHKVLNAVVVDLTKWTTYFLNGNLTTPMSLTPTMVVKRLDDYPMKGFLKVTHALQKTVGTALPMKVLEFRGADIPTPDTDRVMRVEAYFVKRDDHVPLAVVLHRVNGRDAYLWVNHKFVSHDEFFSDVSGTLQSCAYHRFSVLLLRLDFDHDYYPDPLSTEHLVDVVPQDVSLHGLRKYVHMFSPVSDVRFKMGETYFDPHLGELKLKFDKAVVVTDNQKTPVFVTLIDTYHGLHSFKYEDSMWKTATVADHSKLPHLARSIRVR